LSREPESNLKFVYFNSAALQQQQQLIFNSIWNIAIPFEQKIREIEERNFGSVITTIIDNPQNILKRAAMVTESSKWLSVCSTAQWIDSLNQEISKSFMRVLEEKKKGKHQGIRWLCPINIKYIETIKFFSNEGIQFRHLDHIPVNFSVTDKYFNFTIEGLEDNNIEKNIASQSKVLISNDKVHVNHFNVLFERLWKTGTDPYIRLRELEMVKSGQEEQKTELIRNSEEFDKRILQIIESTKHDVMLILGSSNALNQSLNNKAFEAFNSLVKEKSVRIRILLSIPLSSHSEIQLDKEQGQEEEEDVRYIRKIRNYIQNSMYRVQFDLIDNKHYNNEAEGMSVLVVDRTKVFCWESNKLLYENSKSTSLAIYSNSRPLVSSYSSIFESLWSGTQLYNDLKKAYAKISNSERLYKEFVDITAHELRTPIQAIMGYSEMALETRDKGPRTNESQYIRHFEKIFKNSYRLNRLLEDFLSVTRIENNLLVFEKENINIYDLVKNIVNDLQDVPTKTELDEEKKKNISIRLEKQHFEANPIVNVDKTKIYQVLTNLINNALKYSESNQGITISMKIIANEASNEKEGSFIDSSNSSENEALTHPMVNTQDEKKVTSNRDTSLEKETKRAILIKVKDKGKGIEKKIFPNLFEKFVTDSKYGAGTGLGLYISKRIVEIHGGRIWAENNKDEPGATFIFSLPLIN
ncbi:MAG TPA: HAMP domain-containing sensor histidine kinase, partial [Candidatus Nitrosocosmicus sp.]|nr:HAMP domain-containing sensor histidine kinase [Candidatus Nitrosocosmicus sp.]